MNRICVIVTAALALGCPLSQVYSKPPPTAFIYAETKIGSWDLKATTTIRWEKTEKGVQVPTIAGINCNGRSNDASIFIGSDGTVNSFDLWFRAPPFEKGDRGTAPLPTDPRWLFIDGLRWEYALVPFKPHFFTNVSYPGRKAPSDKDPIILHPPKVSGWAIRRSPNDPWVGVDRFYDKLASAKKLQWAFKTSKYQTTGENSNEIPDGWKARRFTMDTAGFSEADAWCSKQVRSPDAAILPQEF